MADRKQAPDNEELSPAQRASLRELREAIAEADKALAKVDRDLYWYGVRQVAKIVFYVICCHVAFWFMFGKSAFSM